eukprot:500323_1
MRITKIMYYNDNSRLKINSLCDNVMVLMIKILIETHVFDYRLFFKLNGNQFQNNGKLTDDNRDEIHGIISHIFIQIYIIIYIIRFITICIFNMVSHIASYGNFIYEAMNDGLKASERNDEMDKQTEINTKTNTTTIQSNENMYSDEDIPVIQSDIQIGTDNTLTMIERYIK